MKTKDHLQRLVESLKKEGFAQKDWAIIAPGDEKKDDPRIAVDHKPGKMIQPTKSPARVQ